MKNNEYDYALHLVMWGKWDELFTLMLRTHDDFLSKKIQAFLSAYYYCSKHQEIIDTHDHLIAYIDHALHHAAIEEVIKL